MIDPEEVAAWLSAAADRVIETSCARIFLFPDRALKVKKPVSLGFLDFSTLSRRKWALDRELAFNRANAPDIYRAVLPITRGTSGELALGGAGETVEWALELRRFDPDAVLANHPDAVDGDLAETLGRLIARAHAAAPVKLEGGGVGALGYTVTTNADHLRILAPALGEKFVRVVLEATDRAFAAAAPLLEARREAGFARRCHGDLHLGNILLENAAPILFDCIEFNDRLSDIDTLYDLAFLVMDLCVRDRAPAANRVLNAYLDQAARALPTGLWQGLALLPLMLAARAAVRAHVAGATGDDVTAKTYLAAAERFLAPPPPRLIAVGGRSGAGKSTFARAVAPGIGGAPGAVILRSDEIRKRQSGAEALDRLSTSAYGPESHARVYRELFDLARQVLAAGHAVVLDAAFLAPDERATAQAVAREAQTPFEGVWLDGPPELLRARLAQRRGDASDADAAVLESQLGRDLGHLSWRVVDAAATASSWSS